MKQNFDVKGGPAQGRANLPRLRTVMKSLDLHGFFIPHEDEYQNEYLPEANERLAWATGFTGSSGCAFVLADRAILFVDGRYTLQARDQLDPDLYEAKTVQQLAQAFDWLKDQDLSDKKIGYDPKLMSPNDVALLSAAASKSGADLIALVENPIDRAWTDRPAQPMAPALPHPVDLAGKDAFEKRLEIGQSLAKDQIDLAIITAPASIAWAFNIRGGDVAHSPLPLARAILYTDGSADLYIDTEKTSPELISHLGNTVSVHPLDRLERGLSELKDKHVSLDPNTASAWFFSSVEAAGGEIHRLADPVALPKACKNAAELRGTQNAHIRDGVAVTRFLHWLDTEAQSGEVTEIDAAIQLLAFRDQLEDLKDISFETISGAGPNGALPHYRVSTASNGKLERGTLYLVDSGGQYPDGTTDITRTVQIGEASADMKRHYTLVLKGHISLAMIRFPKGTTGTHLDTLARAPLWQHGFDYDHGTGHGVGVYLGVHEGPQRIARSWNSTPLAPGMIVSNEPGYYKDGAYGIRIENLQFVTEAETPLGGDQPMFGFECLTFAPLARDLIVVDLLSPEERAYVDAYHADTLEKIGPLIEDAEVKAWLEAACQPL